MCHAWPQNDNFKKKSNHIKLIIKFPESILNQPSKIIPYYININFQQTQITFLKRFILKTFII